MDARRTAVSLSAAGLAIVAGLAALSWAAGAAEPGPTPALEARDEPADAPVTAPLQAPDEREPLTSAAMPAANPAVDAEPPPVFSLSGTVVDAVSGAPIPSFRVYCRAADAEPIDDGRRGITRHDPLGEFHLTGLANGTYDVVIDAGAAGREETVIHDVAVPRSGPLIAKVGRGAHVEGRVLDGIGRPVAGVEAILATDDPTPARVASQRTDAAGRFLFTGLRPGSYRLSSAGAARLQTATIRVGADARVEKDLRLPGANRLSVSVVDPAGALLEGSTVLLACREGMVQSENTGSDGTARVGALPGDRYTLHVSRTGYRPANRTVQVPRAGDLDVRIVLAHR